MNAPMTRSPRFWPTFGRALVALLGLGFCFGIVNSLLLTVTGGTVPSDAQWWELVFGAIIWSSWAAFYIVPIHLVLAVIGAAMGAGCALPLPRSHRTRSAVFACASFAPILGMTLFATGFAATMSSPLWWFYTLSMSVAHLTLNYQAARRFVLVADPPRSASDSISS